MTNDATPILISHDTYLDKFVAALHVRALRVVSETISRSAQLNYGLAKPTAVIEGPCARQRAPPALARPMNFLTSPGASWAQPILSATRRTFYIALLLLPDP